LTRPELVYENGELIGYNLNYPGYGRTEVRLDGSVLTFRSDGTRSDQDIPIELLPSLQDVGGVSGIYVPPNLVIAGAVGLSARVILLLVAMTLIPVVPPFP
jgi:hypothetical protein